MNFSDPIHNYNGFKTLLGANSLNKALDTIDFSYITCPRRVYSAASKKFLAIKVFYVFIKMVVEDIVKNGVVFKLPTNFKSYMFVGDDWEDREKKNTDQNLFSLENDKVMQLAIKTRSKIINKMCIIQRPYFKYIQNNKDKYKLDPTQSL